MDLARLLQLWHDDGLLTQSQMAAILASDEAMATVDRRQVDELLEQWCGSGLLTEHQAADIRCHATTFRHPTDEPASAPQPHASDAPNLALRSYGVEALGYVGATFMFFAVLALVQGAWGGLPNIIQAAILAGASGALYAVGRGFLARELPSVQRIGSVLGALTAITAGVAAATLLGSVDAVKGWSANLLSSAVTGAIALGLYRTRPALPLQLTMWFALMSAAVSLSRPVDSSWGFALVMITLGVGWIGAARGGALPPRESAEVLGAATVMVGILVPAITSDAGLLWTILGLVVALAYCGLTFREGFQLHLVISALYLFVFVPMLIDELLGDWLGGEIVLLLIGAALIATAMALARTREHVRRLSAPSPQDRDLHPVPTAAVGCLAAVVVIVFAVFASLRAAFS